jgi:GMP synthase-like glutamine amidotransferase
MKPIAILQHEAGVTAGHFAQWLQSRGLASQLIEIDRGARVPAAAIDYAGLCSLGGNMSVNDALPWIDDELALLRDAVARGVPVIGHCLGGQLLARALGAPVRRHALKEMGWLPVLVDDPVLAQEWFGVTNGPLELFHWHGDAFELPPGARRILSSPLTANQAYVIEREGIGHIGMQFHIEMTPELVRSWAQDPAAEAEVAEERARTGGPGVQSPTEMLRNVESRSAAMQPLAWHLYDRWARTQLRR